MPNNLTRFHKDTFSVRSAKDVLNALEYSETSTPAQVMQAVPDIWKDIKRIDSTSDKPTARPYQDVLCLTE